MDWLANILIVMSWYATGEQDRLCFVLLGLGEMIYVWIAIRKKMHGLAAISAACVVFCVFNWVKWGRA